MSASVSLFPHLLPEVAEVALLNDEERYTYIDTDRWLPYQRATEAIDKFEDLLKRPRVNRPPSIMLVGRSGNGKSHILDRFAELHPGIPNMDGPNIIAPVMLVETPPSASANDLYDTILYMLNQPRPSNSARDSRREAAKNILRIVETKVLMLDEINHLLSGSANRQREFLFALKHLSNELRISLVIAGTPESLQLLHLSDQVENRFETVSLPLWNTDLALRTLLANFEQVIPLRQPSRLSARSVAVQLHSFGIETIGAVSLFLAKCAKEAIRSGVECITPEILKACAPPTREQKRADRRNL